MSEKAFYDEPLPASEVDDALEKAIAAAHGPQSEDMDAFIAWFKRRYPTPIDRIRYSRRKYHEAMRFQAILRRPR